MKKGMKRLLALSMAAAMLVVGCTKKEDSQPETSTDQTTQSTLFKAGTYEGVADGYGGELKVQVVVSDEKIETITVLSHNETQGIGTTAIDQIPGTIVENQSLAVDAIAGCTRTSTAIVTAVETALQDVASDMSVLYVAKQEETQAEEEWEMEEIKTEVLVIGGGGAGLTAAIAASNAGAEVVLVEKMPFLGGAASISGGQVNAGGSEYQKEYGVTEDSEETIAQDLYAGGHDLNDPLLVNLYSREVGPTFDWLVDTIGVTFEEDIVSAPEHSVDRIFIGEGKAAGINQHLLTSLESTGTQVIMDVRMSKILMENDKVVGASGVSTTGNKTYEIKADLVILATGGFGNEEQLLPESLQSVLYYGPVSSTGDGILMAREVGAKTQMMDYGKIYPNGIEIAPGIARSTVTASTSVFNQTGTILVDRTGKRLVSETGPYADIRTQMMNQEDQTLFLVMDQQAFDLFREKCKENKYATDEEIDQWLNNNGSVNPVFVKADTLEEAATAAGIDPAGLAAEVLEFNEGVESGQDKFQRKLTEKLTEGTYYIVEQKPRFATTLGGLCIDDNMQVLNEDGQVIPGLLAAGEVVGGLHGDDSMPSVCVSWAFTSGRLAGEAAVKHISGEIVESDPVVEAEDAAETETTPEPEAAEDIPEEAAELESAS